MGKICVLERGEIKEKTWYLGKTQAPNFLTQSVPFTGQRLLGGLLPYPSKFESISLACS